MIVKRWSRELILKTLKEKISGKKPLFFASCGTGLVAKLLEKAGCDSISTYSGGRLRSNGWGSMSMLWPILDSNGQMLESTGKDIITAIKGDSFICAMVNANDPLRDMRVVLGELLNMGVFCTCNIPSIGDYDKDSHIYSVLVQSGINLQNEIDMLVLAREMGMVTATMPYNVEDSIEIVKKAKPDIFCFHAGTTKGGLIGFDTPYTLKDTAQRSQEAFSEVLKIKPDTILLSHGASLVTAEDGQYILDNTSAHGVWTGSATERIPIEKAVLEVAGEFANLNLGRR
ncbi:MAG: phosphoenolpyruvate hydrolase family protein [Actinobacteria bacterium]|nr:phosphoenolpyruvate hydrolase family protein [Actinomycetota bacterium]